MDISRAHDNLAGVFKKSIQGVHSLIGLMMRKGRQGWPGCNQLLSLVLSYSTWTANAQKLAGEMVNKYQATSWRRKERLCGFQGSTDCCLVIDKFEQLMLLIVLQNLFPASLHFWYCPSPHKTLHPVKTTLLVRVRCMCLR